MTGGGSQGTSISQTSSQGRALLKDLNEESVWQKGPQFLRRPVEEWPKKSAAEVAADARERDNKLQRKTFSAVLKKAARANERPIDARTQSREDCIEYVTPNSLLLGRSRPKGYQVTLI